MENQLRVLHLVSNSRWTGVGEPAASLATHQQADGWTVWIACIWGRSMEERLRELKLPLAEELKIPRRINPLATLADVGDLKRFIKQHRVQVVHCHQLHEHWLAALAVKSLGKSDRPLLVRTVHRHEPMRRDPWHHWLFAKATDLLIAVSKEQTNLIRQAYPRARAGVETIYGGVNPDKYHDDADGGREIRLELGAEPDAVVGGIVAHLGYNRGHRWLLQAAPEALLQAPKGVVWIVGKGEMKKELRQASREPQYDGRLAMAGYRSHDLVQTYAAMDFAMLLGLGSEGSARAALEAMACGKPVIAVDKGALRDSITHGVDGFLVEEGDVKALSKCLTDLLTSPEKCKTMGAAARKKILNGFTEARRHELTSHAYHQALLK